MEEWAAKIEVVIDTLIQTNQHLKMHSVEQNERITHLEEALRNIRRRFEEADDGAFLGERAGGVAWAMYQDAGTALASLREAGEASEKEEGEDG